MAVVINGTELNRTAKAPRSPRTTGRYELLFKEPFPPLDNTSAARFGGEKAEQKLVRRLPRLRRFVRGLRPKAIGSSQFPVAGSQFLVLGSRLGA
jgi:hypothetical protein